ncbi:hypothetical protein [Arcobacter roscoffensis]|uniref:Hydrogenase-4 component G n=1 Tax=Arcobacter roscoffensis TaxID=2961520 RepID=A0ABY5E429_9BACT|nr:hypothetical protein [Arcobacter roscoffensis]UTJ05498.1 hypothetical protein NJU99_09495 [Arcobacter roscoffensis]
MYGLGLDQLSLNLNNFNEKNTTLLDNKDITASNYIDEVSESKLHNAAVSISISTHNIQNYLNVKSAEFSKGNTNAQQVLSNLEVGKVDYVNFFEGRKFEKTLTLEEMGYTGKPISQLSKEEAKELLSNEGFFGSEETSKRLVKFVEDLTGNEPQALKESRQGIEDGFFEAQKLFQQELPNVSKETESKTLDIIDKKIQEMLKTDFQKELESKHLEN